MATVYFFSLPYHGHINPLVPVIQELVRSGERVVFYSTEIFRELLEDAGAVFRSMPFDMEDKGLPLLDVVHWQLEVVEQCMPRLVADAAADPPAYVAVDYACLWGRSFAQYMGLRLAVVHTTFPAMFAHRRPAREAFRALGVSPSRWRSFMSFRRLDRRVAGTWRVPRLRWPLRIVLGDYGDIRVVLTSREMQPGADDSDPRFHFVGPCVRTRGSTRGEPLPRFDERPLVYVSLGTFWNNRPGFYRACVDAYREARFQVLMSIGRDVDRGALGPLPDHIHVVRYVDQIEVLEKTAAFLTHGGMNSLCEAMLRGVPVLVFPQAMDQFALARHVEALGVGVALKPADLEPQELLRRTESVLADTNMRARSGELGQRLGAPGAARRAADAMLSVRLMSAPATLRSFHHPQPASAR